jgi:multidrug efflux pump subunit AcrB
MVAALRAQNAVSPAGALQTGDEKLALRVSGAFQSELDILGVNVASNGRLVRLADIAEVRRAYVDPPQPMFRVNGRPAIGIAIAMREGGDILTLGQNVQRAMDEITVELPLGIEPVLVANQSSVVRSAIGEFTTSLWQAIAIIMAVSVVSLGFRAGAIVALSIPLTLAVVFPVMSFVSIDLQRISRADVMPGQSPEGVIATLAPAVARLEASLPKSYHIAVGGTVEESAKSQGPVFAVVPLMLFITVTFLMMQLHSFSRLFLVLSVVPMGLIGIVATLLVFNKPLGFVAILGILALLGMIARNAVILIDQIENERAEGKAIWNAVIDAAMSRFRPIMLTAISTVLGMISIAPTIFWGPMSYAIMGGLLAATVLTLIFLPALYLVWFRVVEPANDDREQLRPATAAL